MYIYIYIISKSRFGILANGAKKKKKKKKITKKCVFVIVYVFQYAHAPLTFGLVFKKRRSLHASLVPM